MELSEEEEAYAGSYVKVAHLALLFRSQKW